MKIRSVILFTITFLLSTYARAHALYDPNSVPNNKMGVHILHPSEVETAAKLVNSSGGDWGYVTVPIQPVDRDLFKWQEFMKKCSKLHLIPIIRITTIPTGGTWDSAQATDLVDRYCQECSYYFQREIRAFFPPRSQSRRCLTR